MTEQTQQTDLPETAVSITDAGPARKKLSIEVPAERVAAKLEESFRTLQEEAVLPGFRRGRAPKQLLEKRFGTDIRKEVCNQLIGEGYSEAVEKHELRVLGEPEVKDAEEIQLPESGPLNFELEVEIVPEVELPDLGELRVYKPLLTIEEEQVDRQIERMCEMYGSVREVEGPVQERDHLTAQVEVRSTEGEVLEEHVSANVFVPAEQPNNYRGVVTDLLVEELGRRLVGLGPGDTVELAAKGPRQHENEKLQDRDLQIQLRLQTIRRLQPLTLEQLVEVYGLEEGQETDLRDEVRGMLEKHAHGAQQEAMAEQVIRALLERVDLEMPEELSRRQANQILQRRAMEMKQSGATQEEIEQNVAELRSASNAEAQRHVKTQFIMDKIARDLEIEVTEAELNGQIAALAAREGRRPEKLRDELARSGSLDALYLQLRDGKAMAALLQKVQVEEVDEEQWKKFQEEAAQRGSQEPAAPAAEEEKAVAAEPEPGESGEGEAAAGREGERSGEAEGPESARS